MAASAGGPPRPKGDRTVQDSPSGGQAGPPGRAQQFLPVNVELLRPGSSLGFGLYGSFDDVGRVLVLGPEESLTESFRRRLITKKVKVFVGRGDRENYRAHLEGQLKDLIRAEEIDDVVVAGLAYDLSVYAMEAALERPDRDNLIQAKQAIDTVTDLILSRDQALFALLELTRNDGSLHVHSCNVAALGLGLLRQMAREGARVEFHLVAPAFFFHDLGMVALDPALYDKPDRLSPEEWELIKEHPGYGCEMLQQAGLLDEEAWRVVLQHHERNDGSGYPKGLKGSGIDLYARVCSIADVFDALTSERPYRRAQTAYAAAGQMRDEMSGQLDPELLKHFFGIFKHLN